MSSSVNLDTLKRWAEALKQNIFTLYLTSKDPRTPLLANLIIVLTLGYALSPIDIIPDFIPILGYFDDLLLVPMGIWLAIRLIPDLVWRECKARSEREAFPLPQSRTAAAVVVLLWLLLGLWALSFVEWKLHDSGYTNIDFHWSCPTIA